MNKKLLKALNEIDFSETWRVKKTLQSLMNDINYLKNKGLKGSVGQLAETIDHFLSINRPRYSRNLSKLPLEERRFITELIGIRDVAYSIVGKK